MLLVSWYQDLIAGGIFFFFHFLLKSLASSTYDQRAYIQSYICYGVQWWLVVAAAVAGFIYAKLVKKNSMSRKATVDRDTSIKYT